MVCLLVDSREGVRGETAVDGFLLEGYNSKIVTLDVGDYLVDDLVVWEYKTVPDFLNSLYDESLFNEVFNQSMIYPFSFTIIQGSFNNYFYKNFFKLNKNTKLKYNNNVKEYINKQIAIVDGAIRRLRTVSNVIIKESEAECLYEILLQSLKCLDFKGYGGVVRPSHDYQLNPCKSVLMEVKGVGDKLSDRIIEEFGLTCLDDLTRVSFDGLLSVKGINRKMANSYWQRYYGKGYDEWLKGG